MKILIASSIFLDAIEILREQHDVIHVPGVSEEKLKALIVDREVLVFRSGVQITAAVMASAPNLQLILRAGSGVDNIDLDYVATRGLRFIRIPGPGGKAVAEMSFALMLMLARRLIWADQQWRQGHWVKNQATGHLLTGKVLGIIGTGNIGSRTAALGVAWGMDVMGCVENPSAQVQSGLMEKGIRLADCHEVLAQADFVSIHVPLQDSTRNMIDSQALALMKPGAYLVNMSRGGVVDENALYKALVSGKLAGAALDVHQHEGEGHISPLASLDNVILTPHLGANTIDSQREIGSIIISAVNEIQGQPLYEAGINGQKVTI